MFNDNIIHVYDAIIIIFIELFLFGDWKENGEEEEYWGKKGDEIYERMKETGELEAMFRSAKYENPLQSLRKGGAFRQFDYEIHLKEIDPDLYRRYCKVLSNHDKMFWANKNVFARGKQEHFFELDIVKELDVDASVYIDCYLVEYFF